MSDTVVQANIRKKIFINVLYGDTKLVNRSTYLVVKTRANRNCDFPEIPTIRNSELREHTVAVTLQT